MTRKYIVMTSLVAFLATTFFGCENEDVIRTPDFVVPVILLAKSVPNSEGNFSGKVLLSDPFLVDQLDNEVYNFVLEPEDFDGDEEGHRYFTGRSGTTSSLLDGDLFITYNPADAGMDSETQPLLSFTGDNFATDGTIMVETTPAQLVNLFNSLNNVGDIVAGDQFTISYLYRINPNNSGGEPREIGTPSNDYCGGFTFEGEFCELDIPVISNPTVEVTNVRLTLISSDESDTVVFEQSDADGFGTGNPPVVVEAGRALLPNTEYEGSIQFLNNNVVDSAILADPTKQDSLILQDDYNVTLEVEAESDDHQVFFDSSNDGVLSHEYEDDDGRNNPLDSRNPIGLENTFTTSGSGSTDLRIRLNHMPPVLGNRAEPIKKAGVDASVGIEVSDVIFNISVQ